MLCPKDNVVCDPILLQDVEVDVCPKCQGVWLEQLEVRKLIRHFTIPDHSDVDELLSTWERVEYTGTIPKDFWREDKLLCPRDGAQMSKHYFAGTLIGVDQCQLCKGFWLDGGELQAIAEEVQPNPVIDAAIAELGRESQKAIAEQQRKDRLYFNLWLNSLTLATNPGTALHSKIVLWIMWSFFSRYVRDIVSGYEKTQEFNSEQKIALKE